MKFAHMGDCHLGSWRHPELQEVNIQSFSKALDICIEENVDMVLMAGDIFDSAYPPIEILKRTFKEFKKLYDSNIPCFIVAGSHDYSVSGKTFLDVLEHAGFCKNVYISEEKDGEIILQPTISGKYALYGYPGMKSGLEVEGLKRTKIQDSPGFFKILMLHTALTEAIGNIPAPSISLTELPNADYYALGHLHIEFGKTNVAYSGPIYPNNFEELEELKHGRFQIINVQDGIIRRDTIPLRLKDVLTLTIQLDNTLTSTEKIISELKNHILEDRIILLRLKGTFTSGKISDIRFQEIETFVRNKEALVFVKNTSGLKIEDTQIEINETDMEKVEETLIKDHFEKTNASFSEKVPLLLKALSLEKQEDEKNQIFHDRLLSELKTILNF
jgi:DNA repair exonuclease SbcCD nuclease subunit